MEEFPIRINKYLSQKGISTRKEADKLIEMGKVLINNKKASLGDKVDKDDKVEILDYKKTKLVYMAYNKPEGIVTVNPQYGDKSIQDDKNLPLKLFPVGRLDKDSHGLVILTNDGRITDRLLNPKYEHQKEYIVELDRPHSKAFLKHMEEGVLIDDYKTKPTKIKKINDKKFSITLTEGKNRQIRKMSDRLGYTVKNLQRIRIQNINLGKLKKSTFRTIEGEEKEKFLKSIGL